MPKLVALGVVLAAALALPCGVLAQAPSGKPAANPVAVINLNTATAEQLETLPGIGTRTAARIVEYRKKNGDFKKIEDLMNVQGVGEKSFLRLKPLITVGPPRPVTQ